MSTFSPRAGSNRAQTGGQAQPVSGQAQPVSGQAQPVSGFHPGSHERQLHHRRPRRIPAAMAASRDDCRLPAGLVPPPGGVTLDRLAGDWWIYQWRGGHRYGTDDVACAHEAVLVLPGARRVLELGAGTGSVGLLVLGVLSGEAELVAVEIQPESCWLLERTVRRNGLEGMVRVVCADLRGFDPGAERFDLVVANPPYLQPGCATEPANRHRLLARLELNGDAFDFCRAAARCLAPGGRFVFTHSARDPRPPRAVERAGMRLLWRREVVFREGREATIAVLVCGREGETSAVEPLVVRDAAGEYHPSIRAVRRLLRMEE